jgi:biopolymer transport protein ExbD
MQSGFTARRFRTRVPRARLELLPLLDVVFLLLAVLVLSVSRLVRSYAVPVNLPQAATGIEEQAPTVLLLSVLADGRYALAGEVLELTELERRVAERLGADPSVQVLVQADRAAQHGAVATLLDRVRLSGGGRVLLVATPEGPKDLR